MKRLAVLILFLCASTQAMAADLCTTLNHKTLKVNANGFTGATVGEILLQGPRNGTYSFQMMINIYGEVDKMKGTCKDGHVVFTRTQVGVFVQEYDGWIFQRNPSGMAGVFNHNNSPKQYGWYGTYEVAAK